MFLCRTVEHTLDVEAALRRIEPQQFEEWMAFYDLEPWGDDWRQAANIEAAVLNSQPGGDRVSPEDLIPTRENRERHGGDEVDDSQLAARWKARLGQ